MNAYPNNTSFKGKKAVNLRWEKHHKKFVDHVNKFKNNINHIEMKSLLCGYLAGDGSVSKYSYPNKSKHYDIRFYPDKLEVAEIYVRTFLEVYKVKPRIKRDNNYFRVSIKNKIAYLDLTSIMEFGTLSWRVPFSFFINEKAKANWLKGFFDAEAYVGNRMIQLQSVNKGGLEDVKKLLEIFNIESKIYKYERKNKNWNINYLLTIMKKDSRKRFLNEIGFNHKGKLDKLNNLLNAKVA
ncbi:MAG: hypothetical protein KKH88_00460 [Nanoarchaeota archaeon]|nr:hypothetical protein [Nanoarchaeota archaeon]